MNNVSFLNPEKVLFNSGITKGQTIADLGAGSGYYAIAAAKLTGNGGVVYVVDILDSALDHVAAEARMRGFTNIKNVKADLESQQVTQINTGSVDTVVLANIIHQVKHKEHLFVEAYRMLKTNGKLVVIDWSPKFSPIGPQAENRIAPETIKELASKSALKFNSEIETDSYHYGFVFVK